MFICDKCLAENYDNFSSIVVSRGACEVCGESAICSDIPTFALREKHKAPTDTAIELAQKVERLTAELETVRALVIEGAQREDELREENRRLREALERALRDTECRLYMLPVNASEQKDILSAQIGNYRHALEATHE